jgi:nitrogen fixation protein FixH
MRWFNWGTAVAGVYALFASSTIAFVVFALNRPVELVSADYYERSLQQDQRAAAQRRAAALGDQLRVELRADRAALDVTIPRPAARGAAGSVVFYRPSDRHADRTMPLALDDLGHQAIPIAALERGRWLLRLEWTADGEAYLHERPIVLP